MMAKRSSNSLRICHLLSSLSIGGAERFVIELAQVQSKAGHCVQIFSCGSRSDELVQVAEAEGIGVTNLNGHFIRGTIFLVKLFCTQDILHIHSPAAMRVVKRLLPLKRQAQVIYTRHGAAPLSSDTWRILHGKVRQHVNAVTFVSDEGQRNFHTTHGWKGIRSVVIENGIKIPDSQLDLMVTNKFRLGVVGRLVPIKSQITLLEALEKIDATSRKRYSIDIFGDGECRQSLEHFVEKKLSDLQITFHGNVSDRAKIYGAIDVLVVPSKSEGLSIAILEALAHGIPVIATNVGGNPRLIVDHKTGRLFEYHDSASLAQILTQFQARPMIAKEMGEQGRKHVAAGFSLDRTSQLYDLVYKSHDTA